MNGAIQNAPGILIRVILCRREGILGALTGGVDRGSGTKGSVSIVLPLHVAWTSDANCCTTGLGVRAVYEAIVREHHRPAPACHDWHRWPLPPSLTQQPPCAPRHPRQRMRTYGPPPSVRTPLARACASSVRIEICCPT